MFSHLLRLRSPILVLLTLFVTVIIVPSSLFAQETEGSSPLELGRRIVPDVIGIVAGPSFNVVNGSLTTGCPCTFDGGLGVSGLVGLMYEKNLLTPGPTWRLGTVNIGARLLYETRSVSSAFREYENNTFRSVKQPSQFYTLPILYRHLAEVNYGMLTLTPYLTWNPLTIGIFQPFVQVGIQGGLFMGGRARHTKFILDTQVRLPTNEEAIVEFPNPLDSALPGTSSIVIQDTSFTPPSPLQLAASITLGTDIPIGTKFRLSVMGNYLIPFTPLSLGLVRPPEPDGNFTVSAWQIMLALKMNLER
ncbi:MAG: hypothetical protein MUF71_04460 [Candidatus Kapabacteria bacterium]|jgi:hypothetical protein|nr:hypothetical protein [Candidatus Kapabacteria bacterium]